MKENYIREPRKPTEPSMPKIKGKIGKTSIEEDIRFVADALRKDPEIKTEPAIIQKWCPPQYTTVGSFHILGKIQEGDRVKKGQEIGYVEGLKIKSKIYALTDGIITGLPEEGAAIEYNEDLFTITPTLEK